MMVLYLVLYFEYNTLDHFLMDSTFQNKMNILLATIIPGIPLDRQSMIVSPSVHSP